MKYILSLFCLVLLFRAYTQSGIEKSEKGL